ncbi:MAG: 50S ribosomal protein L31 [Chloroflexi bacterium]|nr:50S ribosomal protein L31 [Chloroflexota bacterium]
MKDKIHPKYYPNAKVICSCGNSWETGSTKPELHTDICSNCHPFFTGQQRIVDTGGKVERFTNKFERASQLKKEVEERSAAREERRRARALVEIVDTDESVEPIEGLAENK